jgi:hypothetical protein
MPASFLNTPVEPHMNGIATAWAAPCARASRRA